MRTAKVCIIGDFAVGKTSMVARFVKNEFSDKYLTTVGVKIDTKEIETGNGAVKLIIWDVAGTDRLSEIEFAYLRGSAGILLVADGTRATTIESALRLKADLIDQHGEMPIVAMLNKSDLSEHWEISDDGIEKARSGGLDWIRCSAKSGENVAEAIQSLAENIMNATDDPT